MDFKLFVKCEFAGRDGKTFEIDGFLQGFYKMPKAKVSGFGGIIGVEKYIFEYLIGGEDKFLELVKKDPVFKNATRVLEIGVLGVQPKKWVQGEYYAHEYDQYAEARARKIEYSSGYYEFEVQCLNKSLRVLDGLWDKNDAYEPRLTNGCGDYFEPYQKGLF